LKKLGSQLTTGDVVTIPYLPVPGGAPVVPPPERVVIVAPSNDGGFVCVNNRNLRTTEVRYFTAHQEYDVEDRPGTVADNDLAILLNAARLLVDLDDASEAGHVLDIDRRRALLNVMDRLAPPNPPTYEELLGALRDVLEETDTTSDQTRKAGEIIKRAVRAGVFK
jgi:hypothetical protein